MNIVLFGQKWLAAEVLIALVAVPGVTVLAYHPSLLPRHRGRDAIHWTIAMHDATAGGTVYWMDDGADTGSVEAQDWCHVLPNEKAVELWRRALAPMGVRLLAGATARLAAGGQPRRAQQDERAATWEPAITQGKLKPLVVRACVNSNTG